MLIRTLISLALFLTLAPALAQESVHIDTDAALNQSLVKLEVSYLAGGEWKRKSDTAIIVRDADGAPGKYLAVTSQQAVVIDENAIELFDLNYPNGANYRLQITLSDGVLKELGQESLLVADNGVAFISFEADPGRYPAAIPGSAVGSVAVENSITIRNFKSSYSITPQYIDFSLRSSGTLADYVEKNRSFITKFFNTTAFAHFTIGNLVMWLVAFFFLFLAIGKDYEPLLLVPIGFGILIGNIPTAAGVQIGVYDPGSVLNYLYFGVLKGIYPPLIFLGIGAMTDFSYMISNPKLILLGGGAQLGIFMAFLIAIALGFNMQEAASIGIIGGADGPTAIFITGMMAPYLLGAIAIAAYSYMALVPVIQPPVIKLLTTKKERLIRMKPPRQVSRREKIFFPVVAFVVCASIAPGGLPLIGMLLLGNILKESGVTDRLAKTASSALVDIVTILIGVTVGASTSAQTFLTPASVMIFGLGALSFMFSTAGGVLIAKFINLFLKEGDKINPIIGCAGVSAVPDSARVAQIVGRQADPENHLLMHAMAPNVAGVIGSAIAAGILLGIIPH